MQLDNYNQKLVEAKEGLVRATKASAGSMGIRHRANSPSKSASVSKIRGRVKYRDGAVSVISLSFPRQLIFTHKGAGRGQGGSKGSRWVDRMGIARRTDPDALGKMNSGKRQEKPFIAQTLDGPGGVAHIATIAAEEMGTSIINNILI